MRGGIAASQRCLLGWERLAWICDITELLRQQRNLGRPGLMAQLRAHGVKRMLLFGIYLAHTLLDAHAPDSVMARPLRLATTYGTAGLAAARGVPEAEH